MIFTHSIIGHFLLALLFISLLGACGNEQSTTQGDRQSPLPTESEVPGSSSQGEDPSTQDSPAPNENEEPSCSEDEQVPPNSDDSRPSQDATPEDEELEEETPDPDEEQEPISPEESAGELPASCDVVLDTCANPIIVPIGTRFTVFFPAMVNGLDATEFRASGQSPQIGVGAVVIAATDTEPRAQIGMQGYNLGPCTLDVTIWYGDNREEELEWSLPCEVIDLP